MHEPDTLIQGRYQITRQVGQGGMGAVYEAVDKRLRISVALKQTMVGGDQFDRAFEREAQLLANLRHSALPRVIDHFTDERGQFLVMEFIPGKDLGALMHGGELFAVADVLRWADLLLDALDYLHTQTPPIIHRDIKPQNLKLTPRGEIILLDFGLAKGSVALETQDMSGKSIFGYTPQYAPLEQIKGAGTDPRSDLYSLGATLYHLLTGQPPPNALTRASEVVSNNPDPLLPAHRVNTRVPRDLSLLLMQAMSLDRAKRFKSAAAMRAAIRSSQQPETHPQAETRPHDARVTAVDEAARTNALKAEATHAVGPDAKTVASPTAAPTEAGVQPAYEPMAVPAGFVAPAREPNRKPLLIATGAVVMLVLLAALGWFMVSRWASSDEGETAGGQSAGTRAAQYPVQLAARDEIKVGEDTYTILSAELDRHSSDKLALKFKVRVLHDGSGAINVWDDSFRLIADGVPRSPDEYPNEIVSAYSAEDVAVTFFIPEATNSVELQVGQVGRETNKAAIDLKARSKQPSGPAATASRSSDSRRQYPIQLADGAEAKAGQEVYTILSAELDRHSSDKLALKLKVRVLHEGSGAINVWEDSFRLIRDGVPFAPDEYPNEVLDAGSAIDVDVMFLIPESAGAVELQVGQVGRDTARIPVDLQ
jgi:hypothetical protein